MLKPKQKRQINVMLYLNSHIINSVKHFNVCLMVVCAVLRLSDNAMTHDNKTTLLTLKSHERHRKECSMSGLECVRVTGPPAAAPRAARTRRPGQIITVFPRAASTVRPRIWRIRKVAK